MNEKKVRDEYRRLTELLIEKKLTITTMESATGGLVASLITDTPGASAVLRGAFVTYSNEAKLMQGVPAEVLEKYSVYSKETAEAMAVSCRRAYSADIGIGITGTTGNVDPENASASVPGRVYIGICIGDDICSSVNDIPPCDSRYEYKLAIAERLYELLISFL